MRGPTCPVPFVDTPLTSNVREAVERDWSTNLNGPAVRLYGGEESAAFRVGDVGRRLGPARAPRACCARGVPRSPWPWRWQLIGTSRRVFPVWRRSWKCSPGDSELLDRGEPFSELVEVAPPDHGTARTGEHECRHGNRDRPHTRPCLVAANSSTLLRGMLPLPQASSKGITLNASSRTWSGPRRRETSASPPGSGSPSYPAR